jgi:predicted nucleic acid-binding protein
VIVVDASAVLEVLLRTADARAVEERLFAGGERLHAPHLLDLEITHAIRRHRLRGEIAERRAADAVELLAALPIRRHEHRPLLSRIWALHRNLTSYDAAYIALAEALGAPLVTRDAKLASAPGHRATVELV